jgi:hypothetical protein
MRSDRKYDPGQQNSSTTTVVILRTPKVFAYDTFMSKFRNSQRSFTDLNAMIMHVQKCQSMNVPVVRPLIN